MTRDSCLLPTEAQAVTGPPKAVCSGGRRPRRRLFSLWSVLPAREKPLGSPRSASLQHSWGQASAGAHIHPNFVATSTWDPDCWPHPAHQVPKSHSILPAQTCSACERGKSWFAHFCECVGVCSVMWVWDKDSLGCVSVREQASKWAGGIPDILGS